MEIHPISEHFAAEVTGVNLARPLQPDDVNALQSALDTFSVLVIPDQALTEEAQVAFAAHFGPLETSISAAVYQAREKRRLAAPELSDISNLNTDGDVLGNQDLRHLINISNRLWHTDSSFRKPAASISILAAQEIPPVGGMTEFADMRAAWDSLSAEKQAQLRPLHAEHDYFYSRSLTGFDSDGVPQEWRDGLPPVVHPLVRKHAGSGRESLYLASHIKRIVELDAEQSEALIQTLMQQSTQAEFVYQHRWRLNDVVIWDNRCTMHRGRPFPAAYRRAMRRATVSEAA